MSAFMETLIRKWGSGPNVCRAVAEAYGDTALLSMSLGKDALACFHVMRESGAFKRIVPFYLQGTPMAFIREYVTYLESALETQIWIVPHPGWYELHRNMVYYGPVEFWAAQSLRLPRFGYRDIEEAVRRECDAPGAWVAVGARANDSHRRRMAFAQSGPIREKTRTFYPAWDLTLDDVISCIGKLGVKLPPDYRAFGSTFDGIDAKYTRPLRDHFPEDFARLKRDFPLIEVDMMRHDFRAAYWREGGK